MKRAIVWAALLTLLWASLAQGAQLAWTWQNPKPQGNDLWSVAYGAGLFVAVGERGVIVTSPDAKTWTLQSSPTLAPLRSVIYAGGRFVAVGGNLPDGAAVPADQVILTSTDGQHWTTVHSENGPALFGVTYGDGKFLAVGGCGWPTPQSGRAILTSTEGQTWQSQVDPKATGFCGVAFGQDRFVAVSDVGRSAVFTSPDGDAWRLTAAAEGDEFDGSTWRGVAFDSGQFVVVQNYGHVRTSTDGEHWKTGQVINSGPRPGQMTAAGDRIFALGESVSSEDGLTWTPIAIHAQVRSVAYGAGLYVAVGEGGYTATSMDGENWQDTTPEQLPTLNAITYADGKYVAVGDAGLSLTSPDGAAWSVSHWQRDLYHDWVGMNFINVAYGNGRFVGVDRSGGKLAVSTDGLTWRETWGSDTPGIPGVLRFANGKFLAGNSRGLVTSTDGENWREVYAGEEFWFRGLAWDGARYVTITSPSGKRPTLLTSTDGEHWQAQALSTDEMLTMAYGNGKFVAVGFQQGKPGAANTTYLLTSTDAVHWTAGPEVSFQSIRYENGLFLATSQSGNLYTSADGEHWRGQPTAAPAAGAAFLNGRLVTTGRYGAIVFSEPVCGTFLDLPAADAACPAVAALVAQNVVNGYPDGSFYPEGPVTRAELAKMLTLALGKAPQRDGALPYSDAIGHWAATGGYLQAVTEIGAMTGYPDGTFRPNGQITRAELVKTILAASGIAPAAKAGEDYSDVSSDAWYTPWVAAAEQAGLIGPRAKSGIWTGPFLSPDQPATRAEAARLLQALPR